MDRYNNFRTQSSSCNPDNCRRCYQKYRCAQYVAYLESLGNIGNMGQNFADSNNESIVAHMTSNISGSSIADVDMQSLINEINDIRQCIEFIKKDHGSKLDFIVSMFRKTTEKKSGSEKRNDNDDSSSEVDNYQDIEITENGLSIYEPNPEETVLVEKRGFLGIGKKWVEEKS